jgi:hypothetical protein
MVLPLVLSSQKPEVQGLSFIGAGISSTNVDVGSSSRQGFTMSVAFANLYLDISSNFAVGEGSELDFSSSSTYESDRMRWSAMSIGYAIELRKNKSLERIAIIPALAFGWTNKIYQDPLGFETYFVGESKVQPAFNIKCSYQIAQNFGMMVGVGTFENFTFSLLYTI